MMRSRFPALRVVIALYKLLGVLNLILTLAATFVLGSSILFDSPLPIIGRPGLELYRSLGDVLRWLVVGAVVVWGGISSTTLYACGEILDLLIAIEENTRAAVLATKSPTEPHSEIAFNNKPSKNWLK